MKPKAIDGQLAVGCLSLMGMAVVSSLILDRLPEYQRDPDDILILVFFAAILCLMSLAYFGAVAARFRRSRGFASIAILFSASLIFIGLFLLFSLMHKSTYFDPISFAISTLILAMPIFPLYTSILIFRNKN